MKGSLDTSHKEESAIFVITKFINYSYRCVGHSHSTRALTVASYSEDLSLLRGSGWRISSICTLFLYLGNSSHVSIEESHTFHHKGKNGWTLTFPDSLAAKAWVYNLALANPGSRAGNPKRQEQKEITVGKGNGDNIQYQR